MYWLTKHTNKKCHSSVKKLSRQNISRKQTVLYSRNGSGEKKIRNKIISVNKAYFSHTSLQVLLIAEDLWDTHIGTYQTQKDFKLFTTTYTSCM